MDLQDVDTDVDLEALDLAIEGLIDELAEWGRVCESIVQQLGDTRGALDAEDFEGAIADALANMRLLDWSGPVRMESLLPGKLDEIESQFETLTLDIANAEPGLPYSVGLSGEHPILLRRFATEEEAAEFVGELEGHEDGIYYLDGPER